MTDETDDLLPVTEEWLVATVPFRSRGANALGVDVHTNGFFRGEMQFRWVPFHRSPWVELFGHALMEIPTRGAVRQLLAVLGIPPAKVTHG